MSDDNTSRDECENHVAPLFSRLSNSPEDRRILAKIRQRVLPGTERNDVSIGPYRVVGRLGVGGMGEVYLCHDPELDREVAVKRVLGDSGPREQRQLRREAQALARLSHPNIVRIYELNEDEDGFYFVMEYIEGQTLEEWLENDRPIHAILDVLIAAGRGLEVAHAHGLVHRDFKPSNVLMGDGGEVQVADFGLATDRRRELERYPSQPLDSGEPECGLGARVGTEGYMAPEQLRGERVDAATDQYAFCLVAYEALWSRGPFARGSSRRARAERARHQIDEPMGHRALFAILRRGLSFDPQDRWPGMTELLAELEDAQRRPGRRRRRLAAGLMSAISVAVFGVAVEHVTKPESWHCEVHAYQLFPEHTQTRLDQALTQLEPTASHGAFSRAQVEDGLDKWVDSWTDQRALLCGPSQGATPAAGVGYFDAGDRCLSKVARRFEALTEQIIEGDADTLAEAVVAVESLPDPAGCAEPDGLEPPSRASRAGVVSSRSLLDKARAARLLGRWDEARAYVTVAEGLASKWNYAPLLAETLAEQAMIEDVSGSPRVADELYASALNRAVSSGHERLVAELLVEHAELAVHELGQLDRGEEFLDQATAQNEKIGIDERARARLAFGRGRLAQFRGQLGEAERELSDAIALVGEWAPELPEYLDALAFVVADQDRSVALRREALDLAIEHFGPRHPRTAKRLFNYGAALQDQGRGGEEERRLAAEIWAESGSLPARWRARVDFEFATRALVDGDLDEAARHAQAMAASLDLVAVGDTTQRGEAELLLAQIEAMRADGASADASRHHRREAVLQARRAVAAFAKLHPSAIHDPRMTQARLVLGNQLMELGDFDEAEAEFDTILAEPRARPADSRIARLRRAELALRRDDLVRADLELVELRPERSTLGLERTNYEVLRSIVNQRLERVDLDQLDRLRETLDRDQLPPASLDGWLDQLGVSADERRDLGV